MSLISVGIERKGLLPDANSPRYFGPEGDNIQETLISDEPLEISGEDYQELSSIARRVSEFIELNPISLDQACKIGADSSYMKDCLLIDSYGGSRMMYGGLDVYKDPTQGFRILEVNPRAQAMGLQDFRQEELGLTNQPSLLGHMLEWLNGSDYNKVLLLGSRKNPFWRGYERVRAMIERTGKEAYFLDLATFLDNYHNSGYVPDVILRFCSNEQFVRSGFSRDLEFVIRRHKIPIVNSLTSSFYGYRGWLLLVSRELPDLFPNQYWFDGNVDKETVSFFPWIKLEAGGFEYVVNYNRLRTWAKEALVCLINRDFGGFENLLDGKNGGDANNLRRVREVLEDVPDNEVFWLGQEDLEPLRTKIRIGGNEEEVRILHRVYWWNDNEEIKVSVEGFGCLESQFGSSKGKINAGTGFSVPMKIVS